MLSIYYDPDYDRFALPDNKVEPHVRSIVASHKSTEDWDHDTPHMSVIDCFRVYVKEGKISCSEIRFLYDDKDFYVDRDGRFITIGFPNGIMDNLLSRLI